MARMAKTPKSKVQKGKPGPDPERLIITDDPEKALSKLLKKNQEPSKDDRDG